MKFSNLMVCVLVQYSISIPIDSEIFNTIEDEVTESISDQPIRKKAMGRVADLGDFYDARTDSFMEISLYTQEISTNDEDIVHTTDITHAKTDFVVTETIKEKMHKLDVDVSLSVSVLMGLVCLEGSAKYLNEGKQKWNSAKTSLVYKLQTKQEHLKIFSNKSKNAINEYLLKSVDATHVVIGLEWGADIVVSLEVTETSSFNSAVIGGSLGAQISLGLLAISAQVSADYEDTKGNKDRTISVHINADIIPNKIPHTINESMEFIKDIPELIRNENNGKGKIKEYILMPITTIRQVLQISSKNSGQVAALKKKLMNQIIQIFQEMSDSKLRIKDAYNDIVKWALMVAENDLQEIAKKKNEFNLFFDQLKADFSYQIVQFRYGKLNGQKLNALIAKYHSSPWTPASVDNLLHIHESSFKKIALLNLLESYKARFVDRKTDKYNLFAIKYHQVIRMISLNLNVNIQSSYVHKIVMLLKTEMEKESDSKVKSKPVPYYIEDDPDCTIPHVTIHLKGQVIGSYSLNKTEYVLLISDKGNVTVMNATSYSSINNYTVAEFGKLSYAVVNDTLYTIDTTKGSISSTFVGNIIKGSKEDIKWELVGSFPSENAFTNSSTAVNGSSFYFISSNSDLYKYDIMLKTVTRKLNIDDKCSNSSAATSMIVSEGVLYINKNDTFCSYDGLTIKTLTSPQQSSKRSVLFESKLGICRVGSQEKTNASESSSKENAVKCWRPKDETWIPDSEAEIMTNEHRYCPGIATTQSGTMIFSGSEEVLTSAEIFNDDTKTWNYMPIPSSVVKGCYFAFSFLY